MQTSIEYEKNILNNVINEFTLKSKSYVNLVGKYGIVDGFVGGNMLKVSDKIGGKDVMWYGSKNFFRVVDYVLMMPDVKFNGLFKKIFRGVLIYGIKLDNKVEYIDKLLNHFAEACLNFINLTEKYGLDGKYFMEYYFACFTSLMMIGLGEIKNLRLYDLIVSIWVLADNMVDNGENLEWVGELRYFFEKRLWEDRDGRIGYLGRGGNPLLDCFMEMERLLEEGELVKMYKRFWKLYKFDYRCKNKKRENVLKYSCLKTRKSLDIFMFAMNINKADIDVGKYYNFALLIQLFDDLMDIKKDVKEGNMTIFLRGGREENTGVVMAMMENFRLYFSELVVFFEVAIMMMVIDNEDYFLKELVDGYKRECKFMDLEKFTMEKIYNLVSDTGKMEKLFKIYLS